MAVRFPPRGQQPEAKSRSPPVILVTSAMRKVQTEEITKRFRRWRAEGAERVSMCGQGWVQQQRLRGVQEGLAPLQVLHFTCTALGEKLRVSVEGQAGVKRILRQFVTDMQYIDPPDTRPALSSNQLHTIAAGLQTSSKSCPVAKDRDVGGASREHLNSLMSWMAAAHAAKPGTLLDELLANLKAPPDIERRGLKVQILALTCRHLYETKKGFYSNKTRVELLVMLLYTMAGPDIDKLMSFGDVPDYDTDAAGWERYCAEKSSERNKAIFSELNWALRTAPPTSRAAKAPQYAVLRRWIKFVVALAALSSRPCVVGTDVARGLAAVPPATVQEYRALHKGSLFRWPAFSSCALDLKVSESYISGEAANAVKAKKSGDEAILFLIRRVPQGISLQHVSKYPKEAELLLPPMMQFAVETVEEREGYLVVTCWAQGASQFEEEEASRLFKAARCEGLQDARRLAEVCLASNFPPGVSQDGFRRSTLRDHTGCSFMKLRPPQQEQHKSSRRVHQCIR